MDVLCVNRFFEFGMEDEWKAIVADDLVWKFMPSGDTISGKDAVWAWRQSMGTWAWSVDVGTAVFLGDGLRAKSQSLSHSDGLRIELGDWNATFNDEGMLNYVCEDILYANYGEFATRHRMLSDKTNEPPSSFASLQKEPVAKTSNAMAAAAAAAAVAAAAASPRRSLLADDDDASEEFISGTYGWNTVSSMKQACTSPIAAILSASIALSFRQCDAHRLSS